MRKVAQIYEVGLGSNILIFKTYITIYKTLIFRTYIFKFSKHSSIYKTYINSSNRQ